MMMGKLEVIRTTTTIIIIINKIPNYVPTNPNPETWPVIHALYRPRTNPSDWWDGEGGENLNSGVGKGREEKVSI